MKIFLFIKRHLVVFSAITLLSLVATFFFATAKQSEAAIGLAFGGRIVGMTVCTCSPAIALFVAGAITRPPGFYALPAGARTYAMYQFHPPSWIKGKYIPGVQSCLMYYGTTCAPLPDVVGTIIMAGTSLY